MPPLVSAPARTPESIAQGLAQAARAWAADPVRPRVAPDVLRHWDALLDAWVAADDLPLYVRKASENRGHALKHVSGRIIVPTDNSPAHWSCVVAHQGGKPSLDEIRELIAVDCIPVAMVFKKTEKEGAIYRCSRSPVPNPNTLGWKVAHIDDVGLGYGGPIVEITLPSLAAHHKRFLSPSNIFLVPKDYAGAAETPDFISAFRENRDAPG